MSIRYHSSVSRISIRELRSLLKLFILSFGCNHLLETFIYVECQLKNHNFDAIYSIV